MGSAIGCRDPPPCYRGRVITLIFAAIVLMGRITMARAWNHVAAKPQPVTERQLAASPLLQSDGIPRSRTRNPYQGRGRVGASDPPSFDETDDSLWQRSMS